jgi:carbon storage regulator
MLVLSRKLKESVVVGGADRFERLLKVTVLDINGGKVRLGFEADADVPLHRSEVWERIVADGLKAGPAGSRSPPAEQEQTAH